MSLVEIFHFPGGIIFTRCDPEHGSVLGGFQGGDEVLRDSGSSADIFVEINVVDKAVSLGHQVPKALAFDLALEIEKKLQLENIIFLF